MEAQIAALPDLLTADLSVAEQLLNPTDELVFTQIHQDLATVYVDLQNAFTDVCHLSAERNNAILLSIETVKVSKDLRKESKSKQRIMKIRFSHLFKNGLQIHLETLYQDLLSSLEKVSACIQDNSEKVSKLDIMDADNIGIIKNKIQQNKVS